jgi:N-methylhydantoinase A
VTDANVVLGRLGPAQELGRSLHIDAAAATTAMQPLAAALSLTPEAVAEAILRLAVAKMAAAVHEISVARGFDPRAFALLSYGGAGPLHAALIAEEIGIPRVIVPPAPGAFSAFGALCSALAKDRAQTLLAPLDEAVLPAVAAAFAAMRADLLAEFAEDGAAVETMVAERQFDLRYRGQAHELTVAAPADATLADIVARFETAFERQFGRRDSERGIDLVNLRLVGRIPLEPPAWATPQPNGTGRPSGTRRLVVDGQPRTCAVWDRDDILADTVVAGPAVIAEMSATTYLPPGWQLSIGSIGQLDLVRDGRA